VQGALDPCLRDPLSRSDQRAVVEESTLQNALRKHPVPPWFFRGIDTGNGHLPQPGESVALYDLRALDCDLRRVSEGGLLCGLLSLAMDRPSC
jgi:hypothetical protein